jgi:LmbE family N-acetylglucosaminyl deacetylase
LERALVISAHPDDPEFAAGGTIAWLGANGVEVSYAICSDGSQGGDDRHMPKAAMARLRRQEQMAAAAVLGVLQVEFLGFRDGHLRPSLELRMAIVRQIRKRRPDLVITHTPTRVLEAWAGMIHPDHLAAGEAAFAGVHDASNPRAWRELRQEGLQAHQVQEIWVPYASMGDKMIDISECMATKIAAISKHQSQVGGQGAEREYAKWVTQAGEQAGAKAGCKHAESFMRIVVEQGGGCF